MKVRILYADIGFSLASLPIVSQISSNRPSCLGKTHFDELLEAGPQGQVKGRSDDILHLPNLPQCCFWTVSGLLLCSAPVVLTLTSMH